MSDVKRCKTNEIKWLVIFLCILLSFGTIDVEKIDSIQKQERKVNIYYGLGQETVWKFIKLIS